MDIMIDLETMSTSPRAAITQIGAVAFEMEKLDVPPIDVFNIHVKLDGQPRRMDGSTILWWLQQSEAARSTLVSGQKKAIHLNAALVDLSSWVYRLEKNYKVEGVWSHGATFDLPIIADAYAEAGKPLPWKYVLSRDTRTLFAKVGGAPKIETAGVLHDALADALNQARQVQLANRMLAVNK